MKIIFGTLSAFTILLAAVIYAAPAAWARTTHGVSTAIVVGANVLAYGLGAAVIVGLAAGIGIVTMALRERSAKATMPRDGVYPVRRINLDPFALRLGNFILGRPSRVVLFDANKSMTSTVGVCGALVELEPGYGWEAQERFAAIAESTRKLMVAGNGAGNGKGAIQTAAAGRFFAGAYDKAPRVVGGERPALAANDFPALTASERPAITLDRAITSSIETGEFALGVAGDGEVCTFSPFVDNGVAVAGAGGQGKTMGSGYLLTLTALLSGWHVVILDAKSGLDFGWLSTWAEYHQTDAGKIGGQLAGIYAEHGRRLEALRKLGGHELADCPTIAPRTLVLIEEFGTLLRDLKMGNRHEYLTALTTLENLASLSRATGFHFAILDQDATKWPTVLQGALGCRLAYRVSNASAAVLKEYKADQIRERGVFMRDQVLFKGWDLKQEIQERIGDCRELNGYRVIDSTAALVDETVEPIVARRDEPVVARLDEPTGDKWSAFVAERVAERPGLLSTPPERGSIRWLAERMAEHDGKPATEFERYKSTASREARALRDTVTLSTGDRLGVDIAESVNA